MIMRLARMLVACAGLSLGTTALADERLALVIGNSGYPTPLHTAVADARLIADTLEGLGFAVAYLENADMPAMRAGLRDFGERLQHQPDAIAIVYFAGHALQHDGENYLLPLGARIDRPADIWFEGLALSDVFVVLAGADLQLATVILDASRSAPFPGFDYGLAPLQAPARTIVALAAPPGEIASDGPGPHGAYAAALAAALTVPGLPLEAAFKRVRREVMVATGGRQTPWESSSLSATDITLAESAVPSADLPDDPDQEGIELVFWQIIEDSTESEDFADYLEQFPDSPFRALARARLHALRSTEGAVAPGPPPPNPEPIPEPAPAYTAIERYPAMTFDRDTVAPDQTLTVEFWLAEEALTPSIRIAPGPNTEVTGGGAIATELPGVGPWDIRAVLSAPGFALVEGEASQLLSLPALGPSSPALFVLMPEAIDKPERTIQVTLWHDGGYLARLSRTVRVVSGAAAVTDKSKSGHSLRQRPASLDSRILVPDLTVHVLYDDPATLGPGQVIVASPHFSPPSRLMVESMATTPDLDEWLGDRYAEILATAISADQAGDGEAAGPVRQLAAARLRGVGCDLYRHFAPAPFKRVLEALRADPAVDLHAIQVFSNNPLLPWEIMVPAADCGDTGIDFLGIDYALARWHADGGPRQLDRPEQRLEVEQMVVIAPRYEGAHYLPYQESELAVLSGLAGYRETPGHFSAVSELFASGARGVVHFAGHGEASGGGYRIKLEDADLDVGTWRGLGGAIKGEGLFFFFNACEVGQARAVASFVEGWAPAVLDAGASGFVGGLWPVIDRSAAAVSAGFYGTVADGLARGEAVSVAETFRAVRRRFHETGDPTFLAYAYYGDVNLRLVRP
jgi:hypothetical protein